MKREDLLTGKTEMRASESASEYNFNGWLLDYIDRKKRRQDDKHSDKKNEPISRIIKETKTKVKK